MRINKRKWIIILAIIVIIVAGAPYLTGQLVKRQFENAVIAYSELEPVQLTITEYKAGWFRSRAKTRLTVRAKFIPAPLREGLNAEDLNILLEHDIRQGPFIPGRSDFWGDSRFALASIRSTHVNQPFSLYGANEKPLLNVQTEIALDGAIDAIFQGKSFTLKTQKGRQDLPKVWKGIHGEFHANRTMDNLSGEVVTPGFDWAFDEARYLGEDWIFKSQRQQNSHGAWLGRDNLFMQRFDYYPQPPALPVKLTGITYGVLVDESDDGLHQGTNLTIETIQWGKQLVGPLNTQISISRLNPELIKIYKQFLKDVSKVDNIEDAQPFTPEMIAKLLKTRPEIHIDNFWLKTPHGDIKGYLQFMIGGPVANDVNQRDQIFDSIFVTAGLLFPQAALKEILIPYYREQVPESQWESIPQVIEKDIAAYVQMGILVPKDDDYAINLRYEQNAITLNGKPWPPLPAPVG